MTQMLLFDSSTHPSEAAVIHGSSLRGERTAVESSVGVEAASEDRGGAESSEHQGGVHRIGDLARLVLLRYELVAKRRAAMAARRQAAAAIGQ